MKWGIAIGFFVMGLTNYFWPGTNGWFDPPIQMPPAEARIVLAILWGRCGRALVYAGAAKGFEPWVRQVKHRLEMFHNMSYANRRYE